MKNIFKTVLFAAATLAATQTYAQTHKDTTLGQKIDNTANKVGSATSKTANKVGSATSKTAKKVGKKTSELAGKGAAAVVDKKFDGKAGPNGELIYINNKSQYYYVNKAGHRVYLTKAELIDKPSN